MTLDELNHLPTQEAWSAFERCCGASAWIEQMCGRRPFADWAALIAECDRAALALGPADWHEAFAHHPRIGDVASLRERFAATATWAGDEQRGANEACEATIAALAQRNRDYESKFGYIFIVCATGRSAGEMLAILDGRLHNAADRELDIAAAEQMKITRLRLDKLLSQP